MLQKLVNLPKSLKNIYLCKKARHTGLLKYPHIILPKIFYKNELSIDDLVQNNTVYVLRRSNLPIDETFKTCIDGQTILNDDSIDDVRLVNLSVNLMGGLFNKSHSVFVPEKSGTYRWNGNKIYLYEYLENYRVEKDKGIIFIKINEFHNETIPYKLKFDTNIHKELTNFAKTFGSSRIILNTAPNDIELLGKMYFQHDPINLNYWHVELKIENYKEILEKAKRPSDKKLLEQYFTNILKVNAAPSIEEVCKINKKHYLSYKQLFNNLFYKKIESCI